MQVVTVCRSCGRTIESDFVYCPWCGLTQFGKTQLDDEMDALFARLEKMQNEDCTRRISKLGHSLDALESDLSQMLSISEVQK